MSKLKLSGPHHLSDLHINRHVPQQASGIFVVGELDGGVLTRVGCLGASHSDIAAALREHVGRWPGFLFQLTSSVRDTFALECALFHEVRRLDLPHPMRPRGTDLSCEICGTWGVVERSEVADRAAYYRQKAADMRVAAEQMHPTLRLPLIGLAESYERLAGAIGAGTQTAAD